MAGTTDWTVAFRQTSAWGTALAVGAGHGIKIESESLPEGIPERIADDNVGDTLSGGSYQGNWNLEGALNAGLRYKGITQVIMGILMGECGDGATQFTTPEQIEVAVAHKHHMRFRSNNYGLFGSIGIDKGVGEPYEYTSVKPTQVEVSHSNSKVMAAFNMLCDRLLRGDDAAAVQDAAALAAVTHVTTKHLGIFQHLQFRVTEITGTEDNLDSADEILVSDAKMTINRNISGDHLSGSSAGRIDEPDTNGFPEAMLEITVPNYVAGVDALLADAQAIQAGRVPKIYKAELWWVGADIPGTAASNKFMFGFDLPSLIIESGPTNAPSPGAKVPVTLTFRVQTPDDDNLPDGTDWAWASSSFPFRYFVQNDVATQLVTAPV